MILIIKSSVNLAINSSSHGAVETDAAEVGIAHPGNLGTADTANRPITRHEGRSTPPRVLSNIHTIIIEAYSWGVGEDESGDGLYCGFEGVVGAAVIGV